MVKVHNSGANVLKIREDEIVVVMRKEGDGVHTKIVGTGEAEDVNLHTVSDTLNMMAYGLENPSRKTPTALLTASFALESEGETGVHCTLSGSEAMEIVDPHAAVHMLELFAAKLRHDNDLPPVCGHKPSEDAPIGQYL